MNLHRVGPRSARERFRRAVIIGCASVVAVALGGAGLGEAWLAGYKLPLVSGATYIRFQKLRPVNQADEANSPTGVFFVLLVGDDERPGVGGARGDALHLVGVNPKLHRATMLNIPRDTCWNGDKINAANTQGGTAQAQAVGGLVGVQVNYSVVVNFDGFLSLVDGVGGVKMNVPTEMHDNFSGAYFSPGVQHLDGTQALAFSRDRHDFPSSDIIRTGNQGLLILAGIAQLEAQTKTAAGQFHLITLLYQHAKLSGFGLIDLYRIGRIMYDMPTSQIRSVTIPIGGGGCLSLGGDAPGLFADFADDAVLQAH